MTTHIHIYKFLKWLSTDWKTRSRHCFTSRYRKPGRGAYPRGVQVEKGILMPMEYSSFLPQNLKKNLESMSVAKRFSIIYDVVYAAILPVMDIELNRLLQEHEDIASQNFHKSWYKMYGINGSNRESLLVRIREELVKVIKYLVRANFQCSIPMIISRP